MSDIGERVKKIVVEHLGVEPEKVTEGASLSMISAPTALIRSNWSWPSKRNSAARIPDDAAETILTVGDAVKFLEKNAKS